MTKLNNTPLRLVVNNEVAQETDLLIAPMEVLVKEAQKCIKTAEYTKDDYEMFLDYMVQICDNAEDLTYGNWCALILSTK